MVAAGCVSLASAVGFIVAAHWPVFAASYMAISTPLIIWTAVDKFTGQRIQTDIELQGERLWVAGDEHPELEERLRAYGACFDELDQDLDRLSSEDGQRIHRLAAAGTFRLQSSLTRLSSLQRTPTNLGAWGRRPRRRWKAELRSLKGPVVRGGTGE